jgi:putative hydrolase of the HAD superfamily
MKQEFKAIFFDFDQTLHDFRKNALHALGSAFKIASKKYKIKEEDFRRVYMEVVKGAEAHGFRYDKTSMEYRNERFTKLLEYFHIKDQDLVFEMVDAYGDAFEKNLVMFPEAYPLLKKLKRKYKLYLVTEGPSDGKRRIVDLMSLENYFDGIFISGEVGKIKSTGELFEHCIESTGLKPQDILVVGDSYARDIQGAMKCKLKAVWFNHDNAKVPKGDEKPWAEITNLKELEPLLL